MSYILAIDQGTTSSRAIIFDREGTPVNVVQKEIRQIYPQPGWVEHDPDNIWSTQSATVKAVARECGLRGKDIAAIGITNQRETTLVWDRRTGRCIHNAIVWQDRRTAKLCDSLKAEGYGDLFQSRTGLVLDAYFSGTKLRWILDHVDGARARAERGELAFGTVDTWVIWNLTGGRVHATDPSNASRTLLYNMHTGGWDGELLAALDIPRAILPSVVPSSGIVAETDILGVHTPVAGIAGDQQAALFGQVCTRPGMVKNTYGTGCFLLMNTGQQPVRSKNYLLTTVAWNRGQGQRYALEGSVFIGGAVVQWLRDGLGLIATAAEVEELASQCASTEGVYMVPAFAGLGAPHWDPYARGTIQGLTRGTTRSHLARAALESIAYQSMDVIRSMEADAGIQLAEVRVDGGATANNLLMQFQADILDVPVIRPVVKETTALGAAYLAGLATDYWKNTEEIASLWQVDRVFEPRMTSCHAAILSAGWHKALERAKGWESAAS